MSDKPPDWSLKKEMQKRKTQEIIRGVEQKRISQAMDPVPSPSPKDSQNPKTATGDAKRTTSTIPAAKTSAVDAKRATQLSTAAGAARRTTASMVPIPSVTDMAGAARRRIIPILVGVVIMLIVALGLAIAAGGLKIKPP